MPTKAKAVKTHAQRNLTLMANSTEVITNVGSTTIEPSSDTSLHTATVAVAMSSEPTLPPSCALSLMAMPEATNDSVVVLARDGALLSSRKPCHVFAWDLLFAARVGSRTAEEMTSHALETFCRGKRTNVCNGINIL